MFAGEDEPNEPNETDQPHQAGEPATAAEVAGAEEAFAQVEAGLAVLHRVDLAGLEDRVLMDTVLGLEGLQRRVDAAKCAAIDRLDVSEASVRVRGLRAKGWKAHRCHLPHGTVARELRVGSLLRRFEILAEALADGRVSVDHVDAVANVCNRRVETELLSRQGEIIDYATKHRFNHFKTWLASLVELLDEDGPEPDHGDNDAASMAADGVGNLHLVMDLTGADAVVAQRIINEETDRQYRTAKAEHDAAGVEMPTAQQIRARAVIELLRRGAKANPESTRNAVEAVVNVTVDEHGCPIAARSMDGIELDALSRAVLFCDALLQPLAVNSAADPLNLRRGSRFFTPAQHKALAARDGGCLFPGCDQPASRCDAHHIIEWDHGGLTDLLNGALLCRRHHRLEHSNNPWHLAVTTLHDLETRDPESRPSAPQPCQNRPTATE